MIKSNLKNSTYSISQYLGISVDSFDLKRINNEEDIATQTLELMKKDSRLIRNFLFKAIYEKVERILLINYYPEKDSISHDESIEKLLPRESIAKRLKFLENETNFILPGLVLPKFNFIVMLLLFVVPVILALIVIISKVGILAAFPAIIDWSFLGFIVFIPYVLVYFLFPGFFKPSVFKDIETFSDFVEDSVFLNRFVFYEIENDRLRKEILSFL